MKLSSSTWIQVALATTFLIAPVPAQAGPATGNNPFHATRVFEPMAQLANYVYVSDGLPCTPSEDVNGDWPVDFQLEDVNGNECIPVFVQDGTGLAELNAVMTVTTCTVDTPVNQDEVDRNLTLGVSTVFRAVDNPGVLSQDLVLTPNPQTWIDASFVVDPSEFDGSFGSRCEGNVNGDGPEVDDAAWFSVLDSRCVFDTNGTPPKISFEGMVIPVDGDGATPFSTQIANAAASAFSGINGFTPIPMIIGVETDLAFNVTGTQAQAVESIGSGTLPSCVGGAAVSQEYAVVVRFAQPNGYVAPAEVPGPGWFVVGGLLIGLGWLRFEKATSAA